MRFLSMSLIVLILLLIVNSVCWSNTNTLLKEIEDKTVTQKAQILKDDSNIETAYTKEYKTYVDGKLTRIIHEV